MAFAIAFNIGGNAAFAFEKKPFIILVAGGSASGKTYTAKRIVKALGEDKAALLSIDNYYAPQKQPTQFYKNGSINYDHPSAIDLRTLALHLQHLKSGFPVTVKEYTYDRVDEKPTYVTVEPKEFIVVEGIFALYPEVTAFADFKIFVDVDVDTRFRRRLARDQAERGTPEAKVRNYFESVVEPMHQNYVQPTLLLADAVVESPDEEEKTNIIVEAIRFKALKTRSAKTEVLTKTYTSALRTLESVAQPNVKIVSLSQLFPTQSEAGFVFTSQKASKVTMLTRDTTLAFDTPSTLVDYLKANVIPVIEKDGVYFAADHHHLILALSNLGVDHFYVQVVRPDHTFDLNRLELKNNQGQRLTFKELNDNPYRSLAALVRDRGYFKKIGKLYEEFEWASFFKEVFEHRLSSPITEALLLEADLRETAIRIGSEFATSVEASRLPGFLGRSALCAHALH